MRLKKIKKLYEYGNVSVSGKRGRGKDMLTANIVVRRKIPYICNVNYGGEYIPFKYEDVDVGNTYREFLFDKLNYYEWNYPDGTDVYLSDCGVYFPSQYCNELNKELKSLPVFMALSRQLGECNVHTNAQVLNRVWDKIREQSDIYIFCKRCIYLGKYIPFLKIVLQWIRIYERRESAEEERTKLKLPFSIFMGKEARQARKMKIAEYEAQHGKIEFGFLMYWNKSKYNTREFKEKLKGGKKREKAV